MGPTGSNIVFANILHFADNFVLTTVTLSYGSRRYGDSRAM